MQMAGVEEVADMTAVEVMTRIRNTEIDVRKDKESIVTTPVT
jgi:hypothetical protein